MRQAIFLSAVVAVSFGGGAAEPALNANSGEILEPVFDCYRANSAWGFTLSGKVIDKNGKIWSYGRHGQAWLPPRIKEGDAGYLTAQDLQAKFLEAKDVGNVEAKALMENSALAAKAAEGKVTQADTGTRDAGISTCHAYIHDETKQRYRDIDLGSDGGVSNVRTSNSAAEAQTLLIWLKSVSVAN